MEVMVGSSFRIGMAAYVRDRSGVAAQGKAVPVALSLANETRRSGSQIGIGFRVSSKSQEELSEESASSIGENSENEEEEDNSISFQEGGALTSFISSLEDSLSIKRGLSSYYMGKSKSFANLMEATNSSSAKDLEKAENPVNKRRTLLIANKLRRKECSASHFSTWINPNSMPLLALQESNHEDHNDDDYEDDDMMMMKKKKGLLVQTERSCCLSSLQEKDDDGGGS
ncbi:hypothetical protein EUTSA_v10029499mg [Eutrema salsugineum]|uniref:Uncharacterized protein n=1 Tax=Eutrema salsugineum TaxID=72664 RepID=V4L523_EUTSA|nr:uncharacterized protein LOC18014814 [Eutrema salsugineum]ESQ38754.1 hypothetical protein EUTSA_v10029499mg [Eutrema salsugineum]